MKFTKDSLKIDAEKVVDELCQTIRTQLRKDLKKSGAIIGISGGIDSSVCAALCAKALGPDRVVGIMMPEKTPPRIQNGLLVNSLRNSASKRSKKTSPTDSRVCSVMENGTRRLSRFSRNMTRPTPTRS